MALTVAPFAAQAETWNIYGWQNHSWEFVDIDGGRSFDRIQSNAGNIGFAASVPTGMNDISVNVRCEQFTYFNHFAGGTGWCNRNSKIGLSHPMMGEIMFATWLLPYNEGVAQWVDPFYDAGADSHTSIMGSVGAHTIFYNTGDFDIQASGSGPTTGFGGAEFNYAGGGYDTGFNRRQENIIQYWSPNWNGFVFRFAWTAGNRDETPLLGNEVDPVIRSSSLAYTNGPLWLAVTWQDHEDWTAVSVGEMESSDAESMRLAGRYIMDLGDGMSVQLSAMWETLEYEFNGVTSVDKAMAAFGYSDFMSSGNLTGYDDPFMRVAFEDSDEYIEFDGMGFMFDPDNNEEHKNKVLEQKTLEVLYRKATTAENTEAVVYEYRAVGEDGQANTDDDVVTYGILADDGEGTTTDTQVELPDLDDVTDATGTDTVTESDDVAAVRGNRDTTIFTKQEDDENTANVDESTMLTEDAVALKTYLDAWFTVVAALREKETPTADDTAYIKMYDNLVEFARGEAEKDTSDLETAHEEAEAERKTAHDTAQAALEATHIAAEDEREENTISRDKIAGNVKIERDAWMVSGKVKFGGPVDFRFSYMDADDLEVSCSHCSGDWSETAANAWNVGVFYTMPAGTELRLTYSEVDNDDNGTYGQGISGTGLGTPGAEIEMFAVGIVHWFD